MTCPILRKCQLSIFFLWLRVFKYGINVYKMTIFLTVCGDMDFNVLNNVKT